LIGERSSLKGKETRMLRLESKTGWWLVTHVDHARLAADFAEHWGNELFLSPEPRTRVLRGIMVHDNGWAARDGSPQITRQGKPSAFSSELVGKYSAFEEIDLLDYLAVRDSAVRLIAKEDPYAAILVSMHTYNLLTQRADRSTIATEQLPWLDSFLAGQRRLQEELYQSILADPDLTADEVRGTRIEDHFRLLQAVDNLSLLSCVSHGEAATLLHPLPLKTGRSQEVRVTSLGERRFCLAPYPFDEFPLTLLFPARHVVGRVFRSGEELQEKYSKAEVINLTVTVTA
jgi:hypothetical protein